MSALEQVKNGLKTLLEKSGDWGSIDDVVIENGKIHPDNDGDLLLATRKKELQYSKSPDQFLIQIYCETAGSEKKFFEGIKTARTQKIPIVHVLEKCEDTYPREYRKKIEKNGRVERQSRGRDFQRKETWYMDALKYLASIQTAVKKIRHYTVLQKKIAGFNGGRFEKLGKKSEVKEKTQVHGGRIHLLYHTNHKDPIPRLRVIKPMPVFGDYRLRDIQVTKKNGEMKKIDVGIEPIVTRFLPYVVEDLETMTIGMLPNQDRNWLLTPGAEFIGYVDINANSPKEKMMLYMYNMLINNLKHNKETTSRQRYLNKLIQRFEKLGMKNSEVYDHLVKLDPNNFEIPESFNFYPPESLDPYVTHKRQRKDKTGSFTAIDFSREIKFLATYKSDFGSNYTTEIIIDNKGEIKNFIPRFNTTNDKKSARYARLAKDLLTEAKEPEKHKSQM